MDADDGATPPLIDFYRRLIDFLLDHQGNGNQPPYATLASLGEAAQADRVCLRLHEQVTQGQGHQARSMTWVKDHGAAETSTGVVDLAHPSLRSWLPALRRGDFIQPEMHQLPPDARQTLEMMGICGLLVIPLRFEGLPAGHIVFEQHRAHRPWSKHNIQLLSHAAAHLVQVIRSREATSSHAEPDPGFWEKLICDYPLPVFIYDTNGVVIGASKAFHDITGYDQKLMHDINDLTRLAQPDRDQREKLRAHLRALVQTPDLPPHGPIAFHCRDGSERQWTLYGRHWRSSSSPLVEVIAIDETELRRARRSLVEHQKSSMLMPVVANMSRLMRSVVEESFDHLRSATRRVESTADKPSIAGDLHRLEQSLEELRNHLQRLGGLVGDSPGSTDQHEQVDLNTLVQDALEQLRPDLRQGVEIRTLLSPDLWKVKGNREQLMQVVLHLMRNALEALHHGHQRLSVTTCNLELDDHFLDFYPGLRPGRHIYLSVEDNGQGIDSTTHKRLFEPLFSTRGPGRGLGLPMVQNVVHSLGGRVAIYSEVGLGTTAKIYLPAHMQAPAVAPRATAALPGGLVQARSHETILLVDDEEIVLTVGGAIFEKLGYRVLRAMNGHEALMVAQKEGASIDMIILDLTMPVMSGEAVFPLLRDICRKAKIVICSGFGEDERVQRLQDQGAAGFIQKPFRATELGQKLRIILAGGHETTTQDEGHR